MSIEFERYYQFEDWCSQNGYNPEETLDLKEERHKYDTLITFYLENSVDGSFACTTVLASEDDGWRDVTVTEGFERKTIVTTKNVYKIKK